MTSHASNILMFAVGSHGDVHPMVAIGKMLRERGHRVSFVASSYFEPIVRRAGLNFISRGTSIEYIQRLKHPDMWKPRKGIQLMFKRCCDYMRESYETVASECARGKTIVVAPFSVFGARIAQEKLGVPLATVHLQPILLRSARFHSTRPVRRLLSPILSPVQRLHYLAADRLLIDPIVLPKMNSFRSELGFPRISRPLNSWIHSPQLTIGLFPEWFAPPQPDWPSQVRLTGFPLYDEGQLTELEPELTDFLNAGDAPIVFTLGTPTLAARSFFSESLKVCQLLGRRGIFLTQFPEQIPPSLPKYIRHFNYVPFSLLLNRAAALVHHAGIGTIAQALRAGIPQLLVPCYNDQPDNSMRLKELGVAKSIHLTRYRAAPGASKIDRLLSSHEVAARCKAVASKFAGTDPLVQTCELIESITEEDR
jgi:rhamnosyltransferase subunit B